MPVGLIWIEFCVVIVCFVIADVNSVSCLLS